MKRNLNTKSILPALCLLFIAGATANAQTFEWAKQIGSLSVEEGMGIVTDRTGNVYITGFFNGTVDFNPGTGTANLTASGADAFLLKLNAAGDFVWVKQMGGTGNDYGRALTIDSSGHIYIAGDFTGSGDFNPGSGQTTLTAAGNSDVFIVKLDTAGNFVWAKQMGGKKADYCFGITVDKAGNIYTTGTFSDTADFNPGSATNNLISAGNEDIFISKLDPSGGFVWAKSMGGNSGERGLDIAVDSSGNVYTTGYFSSKGADFNPGAGSFTLDPTGPPNILGGYASDVFISKLDAAGNFVWARNMGGNSAERGLSIAVDAAGNSYTTGYFQSSANDTVDFDPGNGVYNLPSFGKNDIFISKLNTNGNFVWAQSIGGSKADQGAAIAFDHAESKVLVTGYFNDTAYFSSGGNPTSLTAGGEGNDIFIAQFDTAGNLEWAKGMGGNGDDQGLAITVHHTATSRDIYSTGYFNNTVDFNPDTGTFNLTAVAFSDIYIHKLRQCLPTASDLSIVTCEPYYTLNDSTYTKSGTYSQLLTNTEGCDSIITLDLTLTPVPQPVININHFTLGVAGSYPYATYQWIKDGSAIPGATDSTYTVTVNGDYQVAVSNVEGCTDTSDIYSITNAGIADGQDLAEQVQVYPNPTEDKVFIQAPVPVTATLTDITGKTIREMPTAQSILLGDLADGIYLLRISNQKGMLIKVVKVVKQEP